VPHAVEISICICTYRRPARLLRLLQSLRNLDATTPAHEIIVVDNDAGGTAEPAVRQARAEGVDAHYLVEPVRGIARARNQSLAPARGEYVAFIDDDEEADPQWLVELWREVIRHRADGGFGPVLPRFNDTTPRWLIEGGFFERPRFPTGTHLPDALKRGMRTGNALTRREPLMALPGPFDDRYDLTGGEDTDLFRRMIGAGCRFIAVDSAIVYEHLLPARTTGRWLLQRRFLEGMAAARFGNRGVPARARRRRSLVHLRWAVTWGVRGMLLLPVSRISGFQHLTKAARDLGRFAVLNGFSYRPYGRDSWR
jgi:glycosyltransferase involved in cell wall biosynthesis